MHVLAGDGDEQVLRRADVEPEALAVERLGIAALEGAFEQDLARRADPVDDHLRRALDGRDLEIGPGHRHPVMRRMPFHRLRGDVPAARDLPGTDHDHGQHDDGGEREQDDVGLQAALVPVGGSATLTARAPVVAAREAGVVLVDVQLAVESEVVGVRAEEALDVGLRRKEVEPLLLERPQVLATDLRRPFRLAEGDLTAGARFAEAVADLEQRGEA